MTLDGLDVAECFARKATLIPNANRWPFLVLTSLFGQTDRNEEASRAVDALLERSPPGFSLADARSEFFFCGDQALAQRYIEGLRCAGLPERASVGRRS